MADTHRRQADLETAAADALLKAFGGEITAIREDGTGEHEPADVFIIEAAPPLRQQLKAEKGNEPSHRTS